MTNLLNLELAFPANNKTPAEKPTDPSRSIGPKKCSFASFSKLFFQPSFLNKSHYDACKYRKWQTPNLSYPFPKHLSPDLSLLLSSHCSNSAQTHAMEASCILASSLVFVWSSHILYFPLKQHPVHMSLIASHGLLSKLCSVLGRTFTTRTQPTFLVSIFPLRTHHSSQTSPFISLTCSMSLTQAPG